MITPSHETDAAPPERGCKGLVFLAGAIKYWWLSKCVWCGDMREVEGRVPCQICGEPGAYYKEIWDSNEHKSYIEHRDYVRKLLIRENYLTYAPHMAFKGTWVDAAQAVNEAAISASNVMLVLSPPGIPTFGTDDEVEYAKRVETPVLYVPPGYYGPVEFLYLLQGTIRSRNEV